MENLDEFMRQKFNSDDPGTSGRFVFREEYWEQAQVLIEADRKRRRRRGLLWWWFGGLLLVVGIWMWTGGRGSSSGKDRGQEAAAGKGTAAHGDTAVYRMEGLSKDAAEISNGRNENAMGNTGDGHLPKNGKNAPGHTGKGGEPSGDKPEVDGLKHPGNQRGSQARDRANGAAAGKAGDSPATGTQKGKQKQPGADPALPGTAPAGPDKKPTVSDRDQAAAGPQAESRTDGPAQATDTASALANLDFLPLLWQQIDLPERSVRMNTAEAKTTAIEPARTQRWHFGLAGYGTFTKTSPDGKRLGATAGLSVSRRLTPEWSVVSGLYWRFLPGDWRAKTPAADSSSQLQYSFGYKLDRWELRTKGLHFVELPLGVSYRRGSFSAEAGLATGFLAAVQGTLQKRHSESLQDGTSEERSQVTLDKKPYRSVYFAPFLGGEWHYNRHLALSLRGVYQPGALAKKVSDEPPPGGLFRFDAGLKWLF